MTPVEGTAKREHDWRGPSALAWMNYAFELCRSEPCAPVRQSSSVHDGVWPGTAGGLLPDGKTRVSAPRRVLVSDWSLAPRVPISRPKLRN